MTPLVESSAEWLNSLDAASYFFVSSGMVIGATAALFFMFGVWLGWILWGRFKKRYRESEEVIAAFKGEVAQLKRRIAEQSTRHAPGAGPGPLQSLTFKPVAAPSAPEITALASPAAAKSPAASGAPFTVWTEPGWSPPKTKSFKAPPARAFSLWAQPPAKTPKAAAPAAAESPQLSAPTGQMLFSTTEVFMVPRSRAFCVWTDRNWTPPAVKRMPQPRSCAFALWTAPDFVPHCRGPMPPGRPFILWTEAGWSPLRISGPPTRSARAFTVWTEAGWAPMVRLPRSTAFSVWTDPAWSPLPVRAKPLPAAAVWSLWTSPDFVPACRGALLPSRAFSLWTEGGWTPAPVTPQPCCEARPFSLWAEPPPVSRTVAAARKEQGFLSRMLAAARHALRLTPQESPESQSPPPAAVPAPPSEPVANEKVEAQKPEKPEVAPASAPALENPEPHLKPARTAEPAKVSVNPPPPAPDLSAATAAAAVESLRQTGRVPVMGAPTIPSLAAPLPPSRAFTLWAGGPSFEPALKITQRIALAALIERKITGKLPLPPQAAPVAPVPVVSANRAAPVSPGQCASPPQRMLDLEPLRVPSRKKKA